jgi:uncharacterized protein YgbK (DUF1537 family)
MYRALVVADDLTGASDTGDQFAARGHRTEVATARPGAAAADGEASVLVVDTDSRYAPPEEAAARVRAAVAANPASVVYKKVDSTLRGNLVAEVDAALDAADAALAVVAPAFPANGRTTAGGFHLVGGTPVGETAAGADPDSPVAGSHLPSLLAGSAHAVDHLPLDVVGDGSDAVRAALADAVEAHGTAVVTCDATRDRHLAAVAAGAAGVDADVVHVGSAGLAAHVRLGTATGGVLGVVGSVSPTALAQLDAVPDHAVVALDGALAVTDPGAAARAAADAAASTLADGGPAVLTAARSAGDVDATLTAARDAGVAERDARAAVATALGEAAADVQRRTGVGGLFVTGGAVARRTLAALDARRLRLTGRAVGAGVPLAEVVGGAADGTPVVTKAGGFGDDETIVNCLDVLARHHG